MAKIKWLLLESDFSLNRLIKKLLDHPFSLEAGFGFRVISKSSTQVVASFIERITTIERITDPYGETSEFETTRYTSIRFKLIKRYDEAKFLFEIYNPPRSIRPLTLGLGNILGSITVSEVVIPIMEIYSIMKSSSPRARIARLKASGISISVSSIIRVEVNSSEDAFHEFKNYFPKHGDSVEKIRVERPFPGDTGIFEVSANGLVSFEESSEELVRDLILANL